MAKRSRDKEFVCYFCQKPGHLKRNCILYKERNDFANKNKSAKMAKFNEWYPEVSFEGNNVDSGASKHMCCDISLFSRLDSMDPLNIEIADGKIMTANKKGTVPLMLNLLDGKTFRSQT